MASSGELDGLKGVKHVVLVLSGKGGVGKSTVSTELAIALKHAGKKVGILDIDLCGPSIPKMFGVEESAIHQCDEGWVPVYVTKDQGLALMSIGFLLGNPKDPVVWRGPKKTGTSDEHISVVENLRAYNPDGAVVVTTPQGVATLDVRKELNFCKRARLKVLGVVENMSGYACQCCKEITYIFSTGGGEQMAKDFNVPFLGRLPIDPSVSALQEKGHNYAEELPKANIFPTIQEIAAPILALAVDD